MSSLRSPEMALVKDPSAEENQDSKKIEEEFEQYQAKLKQQKEEWEKEHPDQVGNYMWSWRWVFKMGAGHIYTRTVFTYPPYIPWFSYYR